RVRVKLFCGVKPLLLCFPQVIRRCKLRRESCFHYLNGYGNMTPGTDGMTLDGWSLTTIRAIIQEMQTEQFQFKPVRTVYIPKANGKMRKLGIPSTRDKVVQKAIHMILEAIYDSPNGPNFQDTIPGLSHTPSSNTELQEIQGKM